MAYFITIEGGDGAGKSTLLKLIEDHFRRLKLPFLLTREPGGTLASEEIRDILLRDRPDPSQKLTPLTELFLYEAARAQHVEERIRPALNSGTHVLCDRFTDSTLAYQGYGRAVGTSLVDQLNQIATRGLKPDAVIWLKVAPEVARMRIEQRSGKKSWIDEEDASFHEAVFNGFIELSRKNSDRYIVLDGSCTPQEIFAQLTATPLWLRLFGGRA
ncbi:MAG: dTMP kinase [Bdellovibrionota bacterium]